MPALRSHDHVRRGARLIEARAAIEVGVDGGRATRVVDDEQPQLVIAAATVNRGIERASAVQVEDEASVDAVLAEATLGIEGQVPVQLAAVEGVDQIVARTAEHLDVERAAGRDVNAG